MGLSGELDRGRRIIDDVEKLNPYLPGYLRTVAFLWHLEKGQYEQALYEARRFRTPNIPWDSIMRAATASHLGNTAVTASAYKELAERSPEVAKDPASTICKYFHLNQWVDAMLERLDKAKRALNFSGICQQ